MKSYTAEQASQLTGADYYNILYWLRSGLIKASLSPNRERKPRHLALFSLTDILEIGIIQELRERGAPVQRIRRALDYLESLSPLHRLHACLGTAPSKDLRREVIYLDVSSDDIHVYRSDKEVLSAITHRGQKVIYTLIIDIMRYQEELEEKLADLEDQRVVPATPRA